MRFGLREANQQFSKVMKAVRAGHDVLITERGKPMAVIKAISKAHQADRVMRTLEATGILRAARTARPLPPWRPRQLKGRPITQTLRRERDEA